MGQERTLARGARTFGSVLLTVLALVSLGWIVRDLTQADRTVDVWWMWTGAVPRAEGGVWVSSFLEPTLLLTYAVSAVMAVRSSAAAGILTSVGLTTVLLRIPGLWIPNADWTQGVDEDLRTRLLFSTIGMVVLGAALVVTAATGRRPIEPYGAPPAGPADEPAALPTRGGGTTAFLALAAAGLVVAAWEVRSWYEIGWEYYSRNLTGERSTVTLLAVPPGWFAWALALLLLVAGCTAAARARFSRAMGLVLSAPLLGHGVFPLAYAVKMRLPENFSELSTREQLLLASMAFEVLAGLVALLALARRAEPEDPPGFFEDPPGMYQPPPTGGYGRPSQGCPAPPPDPYDRPAPHGPPGW